MKVQSYGQVHQISFLANFFPVNCYLIEEDSELTLIDAALPYSMNGILKTAAMIGKPITRILLTHAHDDHVGALDRLKVVLPEAKVYISSRDAKLLAGDKTLEPGETQLPIRGGVPKKVHTRPDILVKEGDQIGSLTAFLSPGHTPGSMSFLDSRSRALIAGDAYQTRGGVAVSGRMKLLFPFPALATWSRKDAALSAKKLLDLSPSLLAVGHGNVLVSPQRAMELAIKETEEGVV
ncbi:MBL fold metallo-hydrolase [Mesobacillus harenae]|uniref:MBL fold metallo-hydrolase n=1 Tax=Mesobacillus harenae TaxID=2213203 RepID=UPI00157FF892|nr:MBL fold metallo-hydrolase [Mesobacillus harenae]